uniref:NHS like 2 n=1 Tax=Sphenodon punctatus TaxID=8508 RepID=A0A8D0L4B4_SPHPU
MESVSCNFAPEDPTFSPPWSTRSLDYMSPAIGPRKQAPESPACSLPHSPEVPRNKVSPGPCNGPASFFIGKDEVDGNNGSSLFYASPGDAAGSQGGKEREVKVSSHSNSTGQPEPPRAEADGAAYLFRERSLSVPTDSGSLCSMDIAYSETRRGSGAYALSYPSASSEGSASTDNISLGVEQDAQQRQRTKSISLKKAKKKPSPPTRSVSLIKEGQEATAEPGAAVPKEQRPRSLCLSRDAQPQSFMPRDTHGDTTVPAGRDLENMPFSQHWYLSDWKPNDPYCSLSSSSTATGTTVMECSKVRGSSESLPSPSISRATTPSQLSTEVDLKVFLPGQPTGLMSPSSGYSSQSETPTTTIPTSMVLGHSPHQSSRVKPLVPERKSSLPPVSPIEHSPKSQLSFDLPFAPAMHLDLSGLKISLKGKAKVSRHHSDSTFGTKLSQKVSPVQPIMPMVTQSDLRSIRLRSVSKSEDNLDSLEPAEEHASELCAVPGRKARPPVAEKPPLSRRPPNLLFRTPPVQEESPVSSPTEQDTDMVGRLAKPRWSPDTWRSMDMPSPLAVSLSPSQGPPASFFPGTRRLSQGSIEEEELSRPKPPEDRPNTVVGEQRKAKVPPPVPKKPSVLYLPVKTPPPHPGACLMDLRLTPSPIITLHEDLSCCKPDIHELPSPEAQERMPSPGATSTSRGDLPGNSLELGAYEKNFVSDKTAESITEEDDDVFLMSRTTEDLFTVIHRSKRKLLGWKEPGDAFGGRQNSHSSAKNTAESPVSESSPVSGSSTRTSSKNEDFKALLQKKGSKSSPGMRPSAAELLKTTNPLARRVMTEFAPELDGVSGPRTQP